MFFCIARAFTTVELAASRLGHIATNLTLRDILGDKSDGVSADSLVSFLCEVQLPVICRPLRNPFSGGYGRKMTFVVAAPLGPAKSLSQLKTAGT